MHTAALDRRIPFAPFGFYARITKAVETPAGEWIVEGPLSDPSKDIQGEAIDQGRWGRSGLRKGLATFKALGGVVDWEHQYEKTRDPAAIVGQGIELFDAPHPVTKTIVPWLRVRLFKAKPLAKKIWEHLKAGGTLGFSVAGAAIKKAGARILETIITTVGITAVPVQSVNAGCLRIVKALEGLQTCDWDDVTGIDLGTITLPLPGELAGNILPLFRAAQASATLPRQGPGVDALGVEDLGGQGRGRKGGRRRGFAGGFADADLVPGEEDSSLAGHYPEEGTSSRRRGRPSRRARLLKKAVAYELSEALTGALAGCGRR